MKTYSVLISVLISHVCNYSLTNKFTLNLKKIKLLTNNKPITGMHISYYNEYMLEAIMKTDNHFN
jgi:hypothetical protein